MRPHHRVLLVLAAFAVFYGVEACSTETPGAELNPQPLPPSGDDKQTQNPEEVSDPAPPNSGGSTSSGSSSSGGTTGVDADGGADSGGDG